MSRYIDADHLIWRATTYYNPDGKTEDEMYPKGWGCTCESETDFVDYVNEEPTAIDIVRCKECKHRCTDDCPMCNECGRKAYPISDDFYCGYGEREGE